MVRMVPQLKLLTLLNTLDVAANEVKTHGSGTKKKFQVNLERENEVVNREKKKKSEN